MIHSLEQRYVQLRDEHSAIKGERDALLSSEHALEDRLAEEQRQLRSVSASASDERFKGQLCTEATN
jgi:chromosome segregation ATPase